MEPCGRLTPHSTKHGEEILPSIFVQIRSTARYEFKNLNILPRNP